MAEFHLAAVSGSWFCACWLTVMSYWDTLRERSHLNVFTPVLFPLCCENLLVSVESVGKYDVYPKFQLMVCVGVCVYPETENDFYLNESI